MFWYSFVNLNWADTVNKHTNKQNETKQKL